MSAPANAVVMAPAMGGGEAFTRAILDHATEAILHVDADGCVAGVNRAAERMFGYGEDDLRGQRVDVLMPEASSRRHDDVVPDTGCPGLHARRASLGVRRDGRRFPMEFSVTPFSLDGRVHHTWIVRDVTERTHLEAQLRQSQKMEALGQLAGGVAHDVNNLLTVINGWCEALQDVPREAVSEIAGAAAQAARLTSQLLAFSRKAVVAPTVVDLNRVVADTDRMLQRVLGEDVALEEDFAPEPVPVRVDPGQMSQVLINLAVNARDAMPRGGRLQIGTRTRALDADAAAVWQVEAGPYVQLTVRDTGGGIPADVLPHVFEPFFTTKATGRGTGLGLATVHGIVRQAGGAISVESEPGRGTTFTVLLPAAPAAPAADAVVVVPSPDRGSETVLVVEDDPQVRRIIVGMLETRGYHVLASSDERQALATAQSAPHIDMLVSDVVLPEMSGPEVAERVRSAHPAIGVLFVSGYTADTVASRGVASRGASFLQKPFTGRQLGRSVRDVLDARRAPRHAGGATPSTVSPHVLAERTLEPAPTARP
jgi:two-component system cell cycle sensor histidine kinase/response regulator CckA